MPLSRNLRFVIYMALAIVGGGAIAVTPLVLMGRIDYRSLDIWRIGVVVAAVAVAVIWTCVFSARAHKVRDEYQRQSEVTAGYWGAWLGIGASAPVFVAVSMSCLSWLDPKLPADRHTFLAFVFGYLLPIFSAAIGFVVVSGWRRLRQR